MTLEDGLIYITVGDDLRVMTVLEMEALFTGDRLVSIIVGEGEYHALLWQVRRMIADHAKKAAIFDIERYEWS